MLIYITSGGFLHSLEVARYDHFVVWLIWLTWRSIWWVPFTLSILGCIFDMLCSFFGIFLESLSFVDASDASVSATAHSTLKLVDMCHFLLSSMFRGLFCCCAALSGSRGGAGESGCSPGTLQSFIEVHWCISSSPNTACTYTVMLSLVLLSVAPHRVLVLSTLSCVSWHVPTAFLLAPVSALSCASPQFCLTLILPPGSIQICTESFDLLHDSPPQIHGPFALSGGSLDTSGWHILLLLSPVPLMLALNTPNVLDSTSTILVDPTRLGASVHLSGQLFLTC